MTNTPNKRTDEGWREWTREHQVSYEVRPMQQMQGTQIVQVGFEFEFALLMPSESASRREVSRALLTTLKELAESVFPQEGEVARFELAPFQPVIQLRTGSRPELRRVVRVFHKHDPSQRVTDGERRRLAPLEQRLKELGVKAGSWGKERR